jgi:hypothetical protein
MPGLESTTLRLVERLDRKLAELERFLLLPLLKLLGRLLALLLLFLGLSRRIGGATAATGHHHAKQADNQE